MTYDTAHKILASIDSGVAGNVILERHRRHLLLAAFRYARIRSDWSLATLDERTAMNELRTAAHNALIDACNILSRLMRDHEKPIAWRQTLGQDRKEIGDFACHLHCILGIKAR